MMNLLVPLPSPEARIWSGQMMYEMGIHETIISLFGEMTFTNAQFTAAHAAATLSEDSRNNCQRYQTMIVFCFNKPPQVQNVNVAYVLAWHLQSTHLIRL